jgi:hypothetical protein
MSIDRVQIHSMKLIEKEIPSQLVITFNSSKWQKTLWQLHEIHRDQRDSPHGAPTVEHDLQKEKK